MTEEEITKQAWHEVAEGAQSYLDDWIDEEGDFSEADAKAIREEMTRIVQTLRERETA